MTYKTRKHIWPVSLVAALGVVALLAFMVMAGTSGPVQAQRSAAIPSRHPPPDDPPTDAPPNPFGGNGSGASAGMTDDDNTPGAGGDCGPEGDGTHIGYNLVLNTTGVSLSTGLQRVIATVIRDEGETDTDTVSVRIAHACGTNGEFLTAGLQGTGETSIDEGNVDFQTSDETDRSFDVHVMCSTPTNAFAIEIRNKDQVLVDREVIRCVGDPVVLTSRTGCYSVAGVPDQDRTANGRDIELLTSQKSVQVSVTSYEMAVETTTVDGVPSSVLTSCPNWGQYGAYLRLVDQPGRQAGMPMVDDKGGFVDINGFLDHHGEVVGVDSNGYLPFNITRDATIVVDGQPQTVGSKTGTFRVFTPMNAQVGDEYYVEIYDAQRTLRVALTHANTDASLIHTTTSSVAEYERIVYVGAGDPEFSVTVNTEQVGVAVVNWREISGAAKYHVAALDTSNPMMWTVPGYAMRDAGQANYSAIFTGLGDGVTHIFVLIPETEDGTYGEAKRIVQTTNY